MKLFRLKMRLIAPVAGVCCLIGVGSQPAQAQTGETVYVTNFSGTQVLKVVDDGSGTVTAINTATGKFPEDIVVGPDGKIYICDADNDDIRRIDPSSPAVAEIVYTKGDSGPAGPEGPSFDTLGNLFFNTRGDTTSITNLHTGVWKIPAAQLSPIPPGGATPVNVVSNAAPPEGGDGSTFGEGTTFDANDKLLFVDRSGGNVWRFDPAATTPLTKIITGLSTPYGIAVDSVGDIFVSNHDTHQVLRYSSAGVSQGPYITFANIDCSTACDSPAYLQFDASDRLYVVTNQDAFGQFGKVWRVDPVGTPPSTGTKTQLVDLNTAGSASSGAVVGLALPATTFTTGRLPVAKGMTTNFTDGTIINQAVQIPPDANMNTVATMQMSFIQFAPAEFNSTRLTETPGNTFSGGNPGPFSSPPTTCTPIAGTGGNCIVMEAKCFTSGGVAPLPTCDITAPTALIQLTSHYKTQSPQAIPGLLIADDGANNWANIANTFDPSDPTISGGTRATQMDTVIVDVNHGGTPPADTVPPTIIATTFPLPNGAGWNNTSPVIVTINATDDQLINNITYSATGANPIGIMKVFTASTFFPIANQGSTTVNFCATDNANLSICRTLTVKIDTTPPTITITTPPIGAAYALNQVVASSFACADPNPSGANLVSGVAFCTGPATVDTTSGGLKTFTVNASDFAGNLANKSVNYTVVPYNAFVQQPVNPDGSSVFNAKRGVIPVKFALTMNNAATCALLPATIALTRTAGGVLGAIDEGVYEMAADNGSNFRISGCQYIYNLASSSLGPGTYRVDIIISGAVVGSGVFMLK
jgi:sugar lactone lactonase YvrE